MTKLFSRRTRLGLPNGTEAAYSYDAASQLLSLSHRPTVAPATALAQAAYSYDSVGTERYRVPRGHAFHMITFPGRRRTRRGGPRSLFTTGWTKVMGTSSKHASGFPEGPHDP